MLPQRTSLGRNLFVWFVFLLPCRTELLADQYKNQGLNKKCHKVLVKYPQFKNEMHLHVTVIDNKHFNQAHESFVPNVY